jgi:CheY-like chemotaxis protein
MPVSSTEISSHGGHILMDTTPGSGTSFRLLFPPILDGNIPEHLHHLSSSELPHGQGQHIMVVDDEPCLAELIGSLLNFHGYKTTVLTSGEAALDVFEANPDIFSLLLTDQTMPEVTGLELISILRSVRPDLPVILNTGFSEDIGPESAPKLNIHYLEKPVDSSRLIRLLGELLGNRK